MKPLLAGLMGLGGGRLAALAGVGATTLGLLLFLGLRMGGDPPTALLYNDLDLRDASAMADLLDKAHVPHMAAAGGSSLLVPRDRVAEARLDLAKEGLPSGGSIGYEIFDRGDGLTASAFEQAINQTRAMEGELGRSIRMIRGVRAVRVHLVLAKREPFAQEQQEAQASVLLTMSGAARMDREGVQAILNLVAAAVPGLKSQNIAIVDDRGELLARAGQPTDGGGGGTQDEQRQSTEARLSHEVEEMLGRSLGDGHVRAEASVEMNFDQTRETSEKYDPDGQVARSTQSVTDNSKSTEKAAAVTVQNNLPNPQSTADGNGSSQQRQEETTNYEIGKTVRTTVHDQPQIRRVTLAVMVDGVTALGPDGKPAWHERSAEELARIATLARSVIGFDEQRGDKVDIVSMRFNPEQDASGPAPGGGFGFSLDKNDILGLAQNGLLGTVMLVAVLLVLRPAVMRITAAPAAQLARAEAQARLVASGGSGGGSGGGSANMEGGGAGSAGGLAGGLASGGGGGGGGPGAALLAGPGGAGGGQQALLDAPAGPAGLLGDESMINLGNVEGQIRASSIRRVAALVDRHPQESVAILRGWMAQEAR